MSIVGCLFRLWATLTVLAIAIDIACFWLVEHIPAAQTASEATIYLSTFMVSAPAPFLLVPVLVVVGLLWGLLRSLWHLAHRPPSLDPPTASPPAFRAARHGRA